MDHADLLKAFIQHLREYRATLDSMSDAELRSLVMLHFKSAVLPPTRERIITRIMSILCQEAAKELTEDDEDQIGGTLL